MSVWLRRTGIVAAVVIVAIQFIPVNRANSQVDAAKSIHAVENPPGNVGPVLDRSCNDCHSDQTHWPWYSYVAPVSWVVASDVHEARRKMNFSRWGDYSKQKQDHELEEMCNEILQGDMPDTKYTLIHRQAKVTQDEREAICQWTGSPHP